MVTAKELWEENRKKCYCHKDGDCKTTYEPPESCNYDECPLKLRYEWIKTARYGFKILCDFGQCDSGSMVHCKICNASLCLDHTQKHLRTCRAGLKEFAKYRYEQTIIDRKEWKY